MNITSIEVYGPGGGVYEYDANGNMTTDGVKCYEYNEANQMDRVTDCNVTVIAEYVYDYDGLRIIKKNYTAGTLANTVTSWTESYETKAIVGGGTEEQSYYYANKELVAKKLTDDSINYYHNDHLGSAGVLTDEVGDLVEETKFAPWGEIMSGGTASKFLYTGQEHDFETGLDYYNFRYYNSDIRRFVQPDDIIQNLYNPQDLNRYSYVRNNPLKYTDPSGHVAILAMGVIGGLIGMDIAVAEVAFTNPYPTAKDYTDAMKRGFITGSVTAGAGVALGVPISGGLAGAGLSGTSLAITTNAVSGGVLAVAQNTKYNISNNKPILRNTFPALTSGVTIGAASSGLANKLAPNIPGRPASLATNTFFKEVGKKASQQIKQFSVAETFAQITNSIFGFFNKTEKKNEPIKKNNKR